MRNIKTEFCIVFLFIFGFTGLQAQTVKDIGGNVYKTITIGTQVWMAENLKTNKYRNGDLIETTTPVTLDIENDSIPKFQWANSGNENNVATYGRLYTWYTISDNRNICPTGWHVPSDAEWTTLTTYLGGERVAGGKLKETGTPHWQSPNTGATNECGFTALPSGYRGNNGSFALVSKDGYWWSSTESSIYLAYYRSMYNNTNFVSRNDTDKQSGYSVRCLQD
jgi:uncharacterized protein (TIGR02145 family)